MSAPADLTAVAARDLIRARKLSPVELLESCIGRIEAVNGALNAVVALDLERARAAARAAEARQMRGEPAGVLDGLPIGVKDLDTTAGLRTTYGSRLYADHVPAHDDPHIAAIRRAGGIVLGKTNTPEFGAGSNTTNLVYGATGNPFDPTLTCGGSSGGSAVALATGMVPLATGSDYGGSLRTPASFCGVVGFRPSPGVVPCAARASAFMPMYVLGPMARTVADVHLLLEAEGAPHRLDPLSSLRPAGPVAPLAPADLSRLRVGISADLGCAPLDRAIRTVFHERTDLIRPAFRTAEDRDPDFARIEEAFEILRGLYCVEEHGERLKTHRDLLGRNVVDNTERGLRHTISDVAWAKAEQTRLFHRFNALFDEIDVLIAPATAVSPFPHARLFLDEIDGRKLATYMSWYTITWALSMVLASVVVLPAGRDHKGLPFGIQVVGPYGSDERTLAIALALEAELARNEMTRRPSPDLDWLARQSGRMSP
ncbi:MAG: amidase [Hyphomicrobiaceae bacterium]